MTHDEIEKMAAELAHSAATEVRKREPENKEEIHLPSFQAGMRFARDAFIETLKVTAECLRRIGREDAAKAFDVSAKSMLTFPIVGEEGGDSERH